MARSSLRLENTPSGAAVHQKAQQHRRVVGSETRTAIALAHRAQVRPSTTSTTKRARCFCGSHSSTEGGIKKLVRRSVGRKFILRWHPAVAAN